MHRPVYKNIYKVKKDSHITKTSEIKKNMSKSSRRKM